MGRNIDLTKPLSEDDEAWLIERSRQWQVDENKRFLADKDNKEHAPGEVEHPDWAPTNTVAAPPLMVTSLTRVRCRRPVGLETHAGEPVDGQNSDPGEEV
jgi:hypothetical protein